MLGEIIKRHVLNRKVIITTLLVCLVELVYLLFVEFSEFDFFDFINSFLGSYIYESFNFVVVSTIIAVPLMYRIPIKDEILGTLLRGMLGVLLIMFLTLTMMMIFAIPLYLGKGNILSIIDIILLLFGLIPASIVVFIRMLFNLEFFIFVICTIASFLIAEFVEKRFPPKGSDL